MTTQKAHDSVNTMIESNRYIHSRKADQVIKNYEVVSYKSRHDVCWWLLCKELLSCGYENKTSWADQRVDNHTPAETSTMPRVDCENDSTRQRATARSMT